MKPIKTYLTYIKLPEYMIPYIVKRFGSPIRFQEGDRFSKLVQRSLIRIDDMERQYSRISCSQRAYDIARAKKAGHLSESECIGTPSGKDVDMFVPVVMPHTVMVKDELLGFTRSEATGPCHTLTLSGAQKLRQLVRQLFWTDYSQYHRDYSTGTTHKNDIFRFLDVQNIPVEQFENIVRTETRLVPDMQ